MISRSFHSNGVFYEHTPVTKLKLHPISWLGTDMDIFSLSPHTSMIDLPGRTLPNVKGIYVCVSDTVEKPFIDNTFLFIWWFGRRFHVRMKAKSVCLFPFLSNMKRPTQRWWNALSIKGFPTSSLTFVRILSPTNPCLDNYLSLSLYIYSCVHVNLWPCVSRPCVCLAIAKGRETHGHKLTGT